MISKTPDFYDYSVRIKNNPDYATFYSKGNRNKLIGLSVWKKDKLHEVYANFPVRR